MRLANGCRFPVDAPCPVNVIRLEHGALPSVVEMASNGILVDRSALASLSERLDREIRDTEAQITALLGRTINVLSYKQLKPALIEVGVPETHTTQEEDLLYARTKATESGKRLIDLVLRFRQLTKYKGTYVDKLPSMIGPDGRIRARFNPLGTVTGRMSCDSPNLQNIPVRTDLGRAIRGCFVASPGCVLVSHDLSQIEMRVAAHLSRDRMLMRVFEQNDDIHSVTAAALFRIPREQVDPHRHRLPAKTLGFAILYGVTATALRDQILAAGGPEWPVDECQNFIERWYEIYSGVKRWIDEQHSRVRRYGMLWDQFGRHRFMPGASSAVKRVVAKSMREAGNFPVQALAAGIVKTAMFVFSELRGAYVSAGKTCRVLMQIHDELVHEVSEDVADEFAEAGRVVMASCVPLSVPVDSSSSVAGSLDKLK